MLALSLLFLLGLIFGSFSTVLITRWRSGSGGIVGGRSACPECGHMLGARDLIPLVSYILGKGKCRHCHHPIPLFYPIAELFFGAIFAMLGYASMQLGIELESGKMLLLLIFGFITGLYVLYDVRYTEIPDQALVPGIYILLGIPFFSALFGGGYEHVIHPFTIAFSDRIFAALIFYSFFYLQILIPGGYFLIRQKKIKIFGELVLNYFTFPFTLLIEPFRKSNHQDEIEIPAWIGGGDLRIAIFLGLTIGLIHGIASLIIAYCSGSIVGICILLYRKKILKNHSSQIAFGPFLGFGWLMSIIFYNEILSFILQ